jgi:hypothetical protein
VSASVPPAAAVRPSRPLSRVATVTLRTQAYGALVRAGWRPAIARAAVDEALGTLGAGASLEDLVREALRRCLASGA